MSTNLPELKPALSAPHGLDQIRKIFGDIFSYVLSDNSLDPRWHSDFLTLVPLPFPIRLSWDESRQVNQITCHKLLAETFTNVFARIQSAGLEQTITTFGGCFAFRPQRTGTKLSTHSWGIAIDLNPDSNEQGTGGNIHSGIIAIFKQAGFEWGGDWQGRVRDPMHFQFCAGY